MGMLDRGADLEWISQVVIPLLLLPPSPHAPLHPTTRRPSPTTSSHLCCSQYPHEREILFPPLVGLEVLGTKVQGSTLVVESRFSINMSAQTLEQVVSKRRKTRPILPPLVMARGNGRPILPPLVPRGR